MYLLNFFFGIVPLITIVERQIFVIVTKSSCKTTKCLYQ